MFLLEVMVTKLLNTSNKYQYPRLRFEFIALWDQILVNTTFIKSYSEVFMLQRTSKTCSKNY